MKMDLAHSKIYSMYFTNKIAAPKYK